MTVVWYAGMTVMGFAEIWVMGCSRDSRMLLAGIQFVHAAKRYSEVKKLGNSYLKRS
jgi:hypothetical protein